MNSLNTVYTTEELESQGIPSQELKRGTTIKYSNKIFVRAANHPKQFRDIALEECNKYLESGIDSFVVESRFYLTIWKENKEKIESYSTHVSLEIENSKTSNVVNINSEVENLKLDQIENAAIISQENLVKNHQETEQKEKQHISGELPPIVQIAYLKPKTKKYRGHDY